MPRGCRTPGPVDPTHAVPPTIAPARPHASTQPSLMWVACPACELLALNVSPDCERTPLPWPNPNPNPNPNHNQESTIHLVLRLRGGAAL